MSQALQTPKVTEEAMAFIKAGTPKPLSGEAAAEVGAPEAPKPGDNTLDFPKREKKPREKGSEEKAKEAKAESTEEARTVLVPLSLRMPEDLAGELLRVSAERKMKRKKPYTQQEIVADALRAWLKKEG